VRGLRERGVTIILTTHYIEEAEEMADRIGVIRKGELIVVEDKSTLMRKLGTKQLTLQLLEPMEEVPPTLRGWALTLSDGGSELHYHFNAASGEPAGIPSLLRRMSELGIGFKDLNTHQSSLEDIFVGLVSERAGAKA
jgi:ABC-2 type transport system ATP-binding protein